MFGKEENKEDAISLSEMDDKLTADKDGSYKKNILDQLEPYMASLKSKMASGALTPEEFEAAKKLEDALKGAEALIKDR